MSVDTVIQEVTLGRRRGSVCSTELAAGPWEFDRALGYGPGASQADVIPTTAPRQGDIPSEYKSTPGPELSRRIAAAKAALGSRLVILGHHYQRDEIIRFADFTGDSFKLARLAQTRPEAEFIVFCGVHFMAETADVLSRPDQHVVLPNLAAGCSMADMAKEDDVLSCWEQMRELYGRGDGEVIPVTYMNSSAALKAFCGENGGIVCTSSNASRVMEWAFERGRRVLFFPDQHLGRNTGKALGIPVEQMPVWNPSLPLGGLEPSVLRDARVIAWRGWCSVHTRFTTEQVLAARAEHAGRSSYIPFYAYAGAKKFRAAASTGLLAGNRLLAGQHVASRL